MNAVRTGEPLALLDLVESSRWQRLEDHFARVLGVPIRTIAPSHQLLVNPSWPPGVDPDRTVAALGVGQELDALVPATDLPRDISSLTTAVGVTYAAVPIRAIPEHAIAYLIVGPMVVGSREDELQFRQRMQAAGADPQALWPILLSLRLYTFAGIRSALHLMEEVGTSIAQLAYQAKQLAVILPATSKVDQAVVSYYADRILHSLLDAATLATKADGGSVMLYDPKTEALTVKVAQGLSDAVVASARVKRGEGLAGLAAARRSILIVDAESADESLRSRMRRPELVSSLIAPLSPEPGQEPIGVLNLRTMSRERRFTPEQAELLRRLLDLAGAALASLRFAFSPPSSSVVLS
jgi:hypothetical protein